MKFVIFTDLDETLLERKTYSFEKALPALKLIREKDIPLVICSSKTETEIIRYRQLLGNTHPFISENGGGISIPEGYFGKISGFEISKRDGYEVIILGTPYAKLRKALIELRAMGFYIKGFGDMTVEEIMRTTNLPVDEARMASVRYFDEAFVFDGHAERLSSAVSAMGFRLTRGRLYHITGDNDKGRAVGILAEMFKRKLGEIMTVALGDSPTDVSMLKAVDVPVLVQKDDGSYDEDVTVPGIFRVEGAGPVGWNIAVTELIEKGFFRKGPSGP